MTCAILDKQSFQWLGPNLAAPRMKGCTAVIPVPKNRIKNHEASRERFGFVCAQAQNAMKATFAVFSIFREASRLQDELGLVNQRQLFHDSYR